MYGVLIVDDERMICELLCKLLDFDALRLRLVDVAYDGNIALEKALEKKPDIIITDIRIPGIDGLTLIEKVSARLPRTKFVIISGYKEFDYAVRALKYDVSDYLLKPVQKKQLNDTVRRICDYLDKMANPHPVLADASASDENADMDIAKKKMLIGALSNPLTFIERPFETGSGPFNRIIAFRYDVLMPSSQDALSDQIAILSMKIASDVEEYCRRHNQALIHHTYRYTTYFLLSGLDKSGDDVEAFLSAFYDARAKVSFYTDITITMCVGALFSGLGMMEAGVNSVRMVINERLDKGTGKAISFEEVRLMPIALLDKLLAVEDDRTLKIVSYLRTQSMERVDEIWSAMYNELQNVSANFFVRCVCQTVEQVITLSRQLQVSERTRGVMLSSIMQQLDRCCDRKSYWTTMVQQLNAYLRDYCKAYDRQLSNTVMIAITFMEERYMNKIGLNDIAECCHMNPSYLSTKFKNELGVSVVDYLSNIRIEAAKMYLSTTDYTIDEISDLIGYTDRKYFGRLFKKLVGVTPGEFKKVTL